MFFDVETVTSGEQYMPHLCWIYNDDIQHEFIGINTYAIGMLSNLTTGKHDILFIAHSSGYGLKSILGHLENVKTIYKVVSYK